MQPAVVSPGHQPWRSAACCRHQHGFGAVDLVAPSRTRSSPSAGRLPTLAAGPTSTRSSQRTGRGAGLAALGGLAAFFNAQRAILCNTKRRSAKTLASPSVVRTATGDKLESGTTALFENLEVALELAERVEDYAEAAKLRDQLHDVEVANPMAALRWRQRKQVRLALEIALFGNGEPLQGRLAAVKSLAEMASPPGPASDAEDALHRVLREVSGEDVSELQEAAEEGLWKCWLRSGDEMVDEALHKGMALMDEQRMQDAVVAFTDVVEMSPSFAEGWNKRATALFVLKEYKRSIEDCAKVLELKPRHFGCLSGLALCYKNLGGEDSEREALHWFRKALDVHPGMEGARRMVRNSTITLHLTPLVDRVVDAMNGGRMVTATSAGSVTSTWDVHRVMQGGPATNSAVIYFFRVCVRNEASNHRPVRSLARFYVLQFDNGKVFPFTRMTDGPAAYVLQPGEEYKFCWALIVGRELRGMAGGALLERVVAMPGIPPAEDKPEAGRENRYVHVQPSQEPMLLPHIAPVVSKKDVANLGQGHFYTGQLDLRSIAGL